MQVCAAGMLIEGIEGMFMPPSFLHFPLETFEGQDSLVYAFVWEK